MKTKQLQKLQNLQDAYASLCALTIMIMDQEGNRLTKPSGLMELTKLFLEDQTGSFEEIIQGMGGNQRYS